MEPVLLVTGCTVVLAVRRGLTATSLEICHWAGFAVIITMHIICMKWAQQYSEVNTLLAYIINHLDENIALKLIVKNGFIDDSFKVFLQTFNLNICL